MPVICEFQVLHAFSRDPLTTNSSQQSISVYYENVYYSLSACPAVSEVHSKSPQNPFFCSVHFYNTLLLLTQEHFPEVTEGKKNLWSIFFTYRMSDIKSHSENCLLLHYAQYYVCSRMLLLHIWKCFHQFTVHDCCEELFVYWNLLLCFEAFTCQLNCLCFYQPLKLYCIIAMKSAR